MSRTVSGKLRLSCSLCGPVEVDVRTAELHHNRHDGFRLLQAPCPSCGDLVLTTDRVALDQALRADVRRWELLPPAAPLTDDDAARLREALEAGWPWEAGDHADEADETTGSASW